MYLSLREAAKLLNSPEATVSRWIDEEGLPALLINGCYRLNTVAVMEWASARKIPVETPDGAAQRREAPPLDVLLRGNVHHGVAGGDRTAVMAAVARLLPLPNDRDRALAAQALSEREAKGSTVVVDGIAIPHVRGPLIFGLNEPLLTLCFLEKAVPFGAGQAPVGVVWALATPTIRLHLAMLAKIAAALHDETLRKLLTAGAPEPDILSRLRELR